MAKLVFAPWVGENYGSSPLFSGKKPMVQGESHYGYQDCDEKDCRLATKTVISEYIKGDSKYDGRIINALCRICLQKPHIDSADKKLLFDSIVFYNYLQVSLIKPSYRPTKIQWGESAPIFLTVLEKYKTDLLLVLGNKL